jgi:hypothetical protein
VGLHQRLLVTHATGPAASAAGPFTPHLGAHVKKIALDPETLSVQSFETSTPKPGRGTVFGHVTEPFADSCNVTYCADCDATDPNVDCGSDQSWDCPSVNVANCISAYYTDCGCGMSYECHSVPAGWPQDQTCT